MRQDDLHTLPDTLPAPIDDGACDHLVGKKLPSIVLPSTQGNQVDLSTGALSRTVVYIYPRTGTPNLEPPGGTDAWNAIPGARGCTPQNCAFRDHYQELQGLGTEVYGLSTQTTAYQQEMAARLHLPFEVLSDADLEWSQTLALPTFEAEGEMLLKRVTLVVQDGVIEKVFYPVFPPDQNAAEVVAYLNAHPTAK